MSKQSDGNNINARLALYRKYRPTSLEQVIGQPQVTDVLKAAAKKGEFAQAYLFTGQRGTGKTTVARILAHLINQIDYSVNNSESVIDIIEIDAASNNGVDNIRDIREQINLPPMKCRQKVYIIDEFHMLSKPAFNALLKTIEEPPAHVSFILATTEVHKIPATILSRVQRFTFRPIPAMVVRDYLRSIADKEGIKVDDEALIDIAKSGGGSVRDAVSLLDQLAILPEIDSDSIKRVLGLASEDQLMAVVSALSQHQPDKVIASTKAILDQGILVADIAHQLIDKLSELADNEPQWYKLINKLLEIDKASLPRIKLLSELVQASLIDVHVAPIKTTPLVSAVNHAKIAPELPRKTVEPPQPLAKPTISEPKTPAKTVDISATVDQGSADALDWQQLLDQIVENGDSPAAAILRQAEYRYDATNNKLTLFFAKLIYRKQAKLAVTQNSLLAGFNKLNLPVPEIIIADEAAPISPSLQRLLDKTKGSLLQ